MSIEVRNISKRFGSFTALDKVNIEVRPGELVALLGPSGSGKTTLLRIIAGLEFADEGAVLFDGSDVTQASAASRKVGFAFQHYALFRHMSVFENVAFGLRVRPKETRPNDADISRRVRELLKLVQLENFDKRFPSQLSGGQRQRVALARALAVEPKVLLLDEPFGALDAQVRKELRRWLRQLHNEIHITSIFVTHDQDEALEVAHRIVVMNRGRVEQIGTPDEVYEHPANPFVTHFLGNVNLFHGRLHDGQVHLGGNAYPAPDHPSAQNAAASVYVRPHEIRLTNEPINGSALAAIVVHVNSAGPLIQVELERTDDGSPFTVHLPRDQGRSVQLTPGGRVFVHFEKVRVFSEDYSI